MSKLDIYYTIMQVNSICIKKGSSYYPNLWIFLDEVPPLSVILGGAIIIVAIITKYFDRKKIIANN